MYRVKRGFTLVELIVVMAVIAILATITVVGLGRYQADTRDARRASSVTVLTEALEKYYDANGEYPGCGVISGAGNTVVTSVLPGLSQSALITPQAAPATTNSVSCSTVSLTGDDIFQYVGDGSTSCQGTQGCLSYTIKYKKESTGEIATVTSRRNGTIATSGAPTLSLNVLGYTQISYKWTAVQNSTSYVMQRSLNSSYSSGVATSPTSPATVTGTAGAMTGLTPGTLYYVRVAAKTSDGGQGPWSNSISGTTKSIGTPTLVAAVPAASMVQINLSWGAISGATSYTLQRALNEDFDSGLVTTTGLTGTSLSVTGLTPGTKYYFQLRAMGTDDTGEYSEPVNATTNQLATPVITCTANSASQITATWPAVTNATAYELRYSTSSAVTSGALNSGTVLTGLTGTSRVITGLTAGTTYYCQMRASAPTDTSAWSTIKNATTTVPVPTGVTATKNSPTQVTVKWTAVSVASSYTIQRSTSSSFPTGSTTVNTTGVTGTSRAMTGLKPNTTYYFRVIAVVASGASSAASATVSAVTTIPTVTGVSATANSGTQITVSFTAVTGANSYTIMYSLSSSFSSPTSVATTTTSKAITGLTSGKTYYFKVAAIFSSVTGTYSASDNATTTVAGPSGASFSAGSPCCSVKYYGDGDWLSGQDFDEGPGNYYYAYGSVGFSCPSGTTAKVWMRGSYNDPVYWYGGSWGTTATWYIISPWSNSQAIFEAYGRCDGTNATSAQTYFGTRCVYGNGNGC